MCPLYLRVEIVLGIGCLVAEDLSCGYFGRKQLPQWWGRLIHLSGKKFLRITGFIPWWERVTSTLPVFFFLPGKINLTNWNRRKKVKNTPLDKRLERVNRVTLFFRIQSCHLPVYSRNVLHFCTKQKKRGKGEKKILMWGKKRSPSFSFCQLG